MGENIKKLGLELIVALVGGGIVSAFFGWVVGIGEMKSDLTHLKTDNAALQNRVKALESRPDGDAIRAEACAGMAKRIADAQVDGKFLDASNLRDTLKDMDCGN